MGSILCCLQADDFYEQEHSASPYCRCLFYFFRCFPVEALFHRRGRVSHSDEQGTAPLRFTYSNVDNSSFDTFQSPPRPLSFDDPRCSQHLHSFDGKASKHLCEESESLCKVLSQTENTEKEKSKELYKKDSQLEMTSGIAYIYSTSEDEDTCPICLEEYIHENPRITLQCAHYFHLSCIYEWMERSETCPVCGKMMLFEEGR